MSRRHRLLRELSLRPRDPVAYGYHTCGCGSGLPYYRCCFVDDKPFGDAAAPFEPRRFCRWCRTEAHNSTSTICPSCGSRYDHD
jgi:hypothetical protein